MEPGKKTVTVEMELSQCLVAVKALDYLERYYADILNSLPNQESVNVILDQMIDILCSKDCIDRAISNFTEEI